MKEQSFEAIKENATKYSYLKVYLNNEALKNSAPLVFVDMPGFDSPISSHTHAILEYLERGVHFVILVSVEEGNLTKRMVRELKNLLEFDKGLSFILSKTNLRTPSQVGEISRYIQEQIQDHLDLTTHLIYSNKDNNALLEVADKIDAEKLFSALYLKRLKFLNSQLQNSLKSVMESFDYSKEKALEEIQALDLSVKDIEKTYEKLRANLEEEYSSVAVGSVVKKVVEEVKKQKEKQSLSNRAKEGLNKFGKFISGNKSDKEAPKERVLSDEEINKRAERIAKDKLKGDEKLVSSYDQYEKMKKSGLLNTETKDSRIQANSLEEFNQKLLQFVGADGKYMPYTKAVQISLNNPNLKDLEVIDTPGVNDPIISREERTKALLKDCDAVFIISPSGQFLTDSDMSLFDRVSNKEGLQEIYFVASQADSAVLSMSEVEKSGQHLPTALENAQKALSSQLNSIMGKLIQNYPNQREVFEKAIKNGVILTSGVCFSMHKDFENQASWERSQKTEEYHNALRNLKDSYPDAFSSDDKSKESLLFLSNMSAIEERLEKAAKEKEKIISQKLQDYTQSQANNLHSLIVQLLQDLEDEKKRVKNADISAIKEQIEAYENFSGNIDMKFREAYEEFILHFINNIRAGLEETLKKAIQTAKTRSREEEEEERYHPMP